MAVALKERKNRYFIAGDWGTSNLRVYLCRFAEFGASKIIAREIGPGVTAVDTDFESVLFDLISNWHDEHPGVPIILSGMIGSNIGWQSAPYTQCPARYDDIALASIKFRIKHHDVRIIYGIETKNFFGQYDVMRGEELQVLGWRQLENRIQTSQPNVLALPGTHNKWIVADDSGINNFTTSITGELFALLKKHSVLIGGDKADNFSNEEFNQGLQMSNDSSVDSLVHSLFSVRSRQISGNLNGTHASSFLSGLLIGADINGALSFLDKRGLKLPKVSLIGEPKLCNLYQIALSKHQINALIYKPETVAVAGYTQVYRQHYL